MRAKYLYKVPNKVYYLSNRSDIVLTNVRSLTTYYEKRKRFEKQTFINSKSR